MRTVNEPEPLCSELTTCKLWAGDWAETLSSQPNNSKTVRDSLHMCQLEADRNPLTLVFQIFHKKQNVQGGGQVVYDLFSPVELFTTMQYTNDAHKMLDEAKHKVLKNIIVAIGDADSLWALRLKIVL